MAKGTKKVDDADGGKEETKRTSFILRSILSKKLNYIKVMDNADITDMVDEALSEFVAKWEKKNGTIPVK